MVRPPAEGRTTQPPQASPQSPLARRNGREPLTITVVYRGGPEAFYEVRARGRVWRRPGHLALHDVMTEINEGQGYGRG